MLRLSSPSKRFKPALDKHNGIFRRHASNAVLKNSWLGDYQSKPYTEHFLNGSSLVHVPFSPLNNGYTVQAKLKIGQPNDRYEQEADRVAKQVMHMPDPGTSVYSTAQATQKVPNTLQRTCSSCANEFNSAEEEQWDTTQANLCLQCQHQEKDVIQTKLSDGQIQREMEELEDEEELLQTKSSSVPTPAVTAEAANGIQSLRGGGRPMSKAERGFFEPRFGADFSHVRLHIDSRAAKTAQAVNARAFTLGQDVVFNSGEYAANASASRKLLAHELTHVMQQSRMNNSSITGLQKKSTDHTRPKQTVPSAGSEGKECQVNCPYDCDIVSTDYLDVWKKEIAKVGGSINSVKWEMFKCIDYSNVPPNTVDYLCRVKIKIVRPECREENNPGEFEENLDIFIFGYKGKGLILASSKTAGYCWYQKQCDNGTNRIRRHSCHLNKPQTPIFCEWN